MLPSKVRQMRSPVYCDMDAERRPTADIYSHSANNLKSRAYGALIHGAPNTLTIRQKEDHAWRRRILSLAFSDARMLSYETILKRHINALCDNLEDNSKLRDGATAEYLLDMSLQSTREQLFPSQFNF
jgi:cytochrome P450